MKKLRLFVLLSVLASGAILSSCKEEIDNDGTYVETPIVFCLLNQTDSLHFIKITKSFDGASNALDVAQIPDSSYYQNLTITVKEFVANNLMRTWTTNAGIRDTIITDKEPGVFYSPNQKLYYFQTSNANPLRTDATYKFEAVMNNGEYKVNGETKLLSDINVTYPSSNQAFSFMTTVNNAPTYFNATAKISHGSAKILDCRLKVFYNEYFNGVPVEKSFIWKVGEVNGSDIQGTITQFKLSGETFYTLIKEDATDDPSIDKRELTRLQLIVTGGTDDLSKYILVSQPSSSLAQNKPTYTNLTRSDGLPVIGLFTSRSSIILEKLKYSTFNPAIRAIDKNSMKELCSGAITGSLLFCSDNPTDQAESWFCN